MLVCDAYTCIISINRILTVDVYLHSDLPGENSVELDAFSSQTQRELLENNLLPSSQPETVV